MPHATRNAHGDVSKDLPANRIGLPERSERDWVGNEALRYEGLLKFVSAAQALLARVSNTASASASQPSASAMLHMARSKLRRRSGSAISASKLSISALSTRIALCDVDVSNS